MYLYLFTRHTHTHTHTHSLIEEGGDWDRRNRLRTYEGVYAMAIRDFKTAASCFFETMATFTSTELMDYRTFVKYAVFSCMVAMDRSDVKSKVCVCGILALGQFFK